MVRDFFFSSNDGSGTVLKMSCVFLGCREQGYLNIYPPGQSEVAVQ